MSFVGHLIEISLRFGAVSHRFKEVILCVLHALVAFLVFFADVSVVRVGELDIERFTMLCARYNVVPHIDLLISVSVEEARVPLGGGIVGQVGA